MLVLEYCYCPQFSQVAHSTKAHHQKEFGTAAIERPLSSQFLDEFGPGKS
jgi:hypothetical protein